MFSFFLCDTVLAEECSAEDMAKAKALADNVDVKYEYIGKKEGSGVLFDDQYHITITGIVEGIEVGISDGTSNDESIYTYTSGEVKDGSLEFDNGVGDLNVNVYKFNCSGKALKTNTIELYGKNLYADYPACKKLEKYHLDVCDEDYHGEVDDELFYNTISSYLDEDNVGSSNLNSFIMRYFWLFLCGGFLCLGLIVLIVYRHRKRSVLK